MAWKITKSRAVWLFYARWFLYGIIWSYLNISEFLQEPPRNGFSGWFWGGFYGFGCDLIKNIDVNACRARYEWFDYVNIWPVVFVIIGVLWRLERDGQVPKVFAQD